MARNGVLWYRDTNHVNILGSRLVGNYVTEQTPILDELRVEYVK